MPFNLSLKTKISLTFTLLVMAILCVVAALTYHYSRTELKKNITDQQTTLVNSLASQLDERLHLIQEQLARFSVKMDAKMVDDPHRLQKLLNEEEDLRVIFNAGMLIVDASGKIMAEYPYHSELIGTTIPQETEFFKDTLSSKKPNISSPFMYPYFDEPMIAFTIPFFNADGSLRAMIVGRHKLWSGKFLSSLADIRIGRAGYLYIIDKDRDIVVHPDKNRALERIRVGANHGIELALKGFEGTLENVNSRGVAGLSTFKRLTAASWILAAHHPLKDAYQPIERAAGYFLLIIVCAGMLSALVIRYVMHRLTLPLLKLTEHVSAIGDKQGEDRLVLIDSRDEIGKLAKVFNTMFVEIDNQQLKLDDERIFVENLVMNSAAPIFVLDRDHRIIYWNKALEKLTGFTSADMKGTGRHWEPFYGEKRPTLADIVLDHTDGNLPKLYDNFRPSRFIEGAFQAEGWFRFAATGRHYLYFHASPVKNSTGEVVGVVETLEDFTESKQIEEMLNEQYRFLQEIIDAIPIPVYYKDRLARYIGCNRAFEEFFGQSKNNILGKTVHNLNQGEYAAGHEKMDQECIKSSSNQNYESSFVRSDGAIRDAIVTKAPYYDKKGKPAGLVATFTDITERRAMTEELQKAYDELKNTQMKAFQQEKLASIGQLAAGVAHEINNPMGFISSNLGTLGKYVDRLGEFVAMLSDIISGCATVERIADIGEQRKRLKIDYILEDTRQLIIESQDGAQRVRKIVQDLKSFSRVDEADRKHADINECLDSTINIAWNEIKYVATLTREFGEIPQVLCYPQQLNQVFMNLLVNAAHAIEGQGEIRVRTWKDDANVFVSVEDNGRGIPPEVAGRIFEPFFTTKEVGKGTGLGLSISYDIIKKHDGDISVESEVGKGSTFTVRFPCG